MKTSSTSINTPTLAVALWAAGFLALVDIFATPSSEAWVLGLSPQRLALALIPLAWMLACLLGAVLAILSPERFRRAAAALGRLTSQHARITGSLSLWTAPLLAGAVLYERLAVAPHVPALAEKLGIWFPTLCGYLDRLGPVLLFVAAALACWALYTLTVLKIPFYRDAALLAGSGAAVLAALATLFQWLVWVFQLRVFEQIPGYYWPVVAKPGLARHALLFGVLLLAFWLILAVVRRAPRSLGSGLALACLAFIGLQGAIGFLDGRGLASLTDRFFLSYHRIYIEEACNAQVSAREAVVNYETRYPGMFLQTKPPGVLWLSFQINRAASSPLLAPALDRLSETLSLSVAIPRMQAPACRRSMALVTLLFPILAALAVAAIYAFTRWILPGAEPGWLAGYSALLFILTPNAVMLSLFMDQALYPALFLALAGGSLAAVRRSSWAAGIGMGAVLYGAIFLSFTMLPVLAVPVVYFACLLWQERDWKAIGTQFIRRLLPLGVGALLAGLLFKLLLNYDVLTRYQRMMATRIEGDFYTRFGLQSSGDPTLLEKLRQTWEAARLNNVELAVAVGFPLFILFAVVGIRSIVRVIRRDPDPAAAVNASLFLAYVALNALRVVQGEVARLWIFWTPVMAILAVQVLLPFTRRARWLMPALVAVQLLSVFLAYQYQDYWMPQLLP